jgi:Carboxypeptidase regulatory-like domain/TonB-dependent Receptor Plug Domain
MKTTRIWGVFSLFLFLAATLCGVTAIAQDTAGSVNGSVTDATTAILPGATVTISNQVTGYTRTAKTDSTGQFHFYNVPFNPYRLTVSSAGFQTLAKSLQVSSSVPMSVPLTLQVSGNTTTVEVEAPVDLVERDSTAHTDIDRSLIDRLPVESPSSELSSIVTLSSPGVAADSNGLMHGLGDHAENSFNVDGQPITDQQSKVFSNQLPAAAVQSLEVIEGAPPAEYGDKTSLVVKVTTRSGQGVTKPTGSVSLSYGTFGTSNLAFDTAYGGQNWGNFIAASGLQSGRFLDGPEFAVLHDKGNEENFFDRVDFQFGQKDSLHLNLQYTRSWFQTPNDFENYAAFGQNNGGSADQRSKIGTVDFAPTYTHIVNDETVINFGAYLRRDAYNYYPSNNPLDDYALDQQQETVTQQRTLMNAGTHADISYAHGINNAKLGGMYSQTFLRENDQIGIVDPTLNQTYNPILTPFDLTLGGSLYHWSGRTDVKQLALFGQDTITAGKWLFNLGIRGDIYNGLTIQKQAEPRAGVSYSVKKTGTVLRTSYARTQETPFNENLVLSSTGCGNPVLFAIFATLSDGSCSAQAPTPFNPGFRNEFHAGFEQSAGRHFVFNGEYIWKYTHNAYDFSVLGTTPITFPIEWHNSKIPGYAISATLTDIKGFSARFNASSVAARFFTPQLGGVGATPGSANTAAGASGIVPFRIDHDEKFNQTTHVQYNMPFRKSMWYGFNWRYDTGLVAGAAPCYNPNGANTDCDPTTATTVDGQPGINLTGLSADQQFQAGLVCADQGAGLGPAKATPTYQLQQCTATGLSSKLLQIPAPNTENADLNPSRIASRNLFDMSLGDDRVAHFGGDRYRIAARVTAINVANKYALYNFLSTFSGTHYVTPRTVTGQVSFNF